MVMRAGVEELRKKVERYIQTQRPGLRLTVMWPTKTPSMEDPNIAFEFVIGAERATVTLSAADLEEGENWKEQVDAILAKMTTR